MPLEHVELSIVLPCYNEEKNIPPLLSKLSELSVGRAFEIILVNNGSLDNSQKVFERQLPQLANSEQFRLITLRKNNGYGHGIMKGLQECRGRVLSYSHADLQCDPLNIVEAYDLFKKTEIERPGEDFIVKGKRFERRENEKFLSFNLDRIASAFLGVPLADINGQPKMFSRRFYEEQLKGKGPWDLTFDVFLMARAAKSGRKILTMPVFFAERKAGVSSWNTTTLSRIRMVFRFIKTIISVRIYSGRAD